MKSSIYCKEKKNKIKNLKRRVDQNLIFIQVIRAKCDGINRRGQILQSLLDSPRASFTFPTSEILDIEQITDLRRLRVYIFDDLLSFTCQEIRGNLLMQMQKEMQMWVVSRDGLEASCPKMPFP